MPFRSLYPDVSIPETSLSRFVLDGAAARGDKPALIDGPTGRTITYAQLPVLISRVAAGLAARGFKKGERFAIYSPNLPEYAVAFHAIASLGGVVTTVNPLYTAAELAKQLNDSQARFLLTVPPFLANAREAAAQSKVEEIFVFGEAEGATPFASLLAGGGSPPTVPIDARKDLVALPYSRNHRAAQRCDAHALQPGCSAVLPERCNRRQTGRTRGYRARVSTVLPYLRYRRVP